MNFQDWMSITVAMLGVISAAVICWQVYMLVDLREYRKEFIKLKLDIQTEKQIQRNALREFAAETKMLDAAHIIGSFNEERGNYEAIGIGYCSLIHALKILVYSNNEMINEILGLMRKCVCLAQTYDAWDKMFPKEIEDLSKEEYPFIVAGLMGQQDYLSQLDNIKKWRQEKHMDKKAYEETVRNF